LSESAPHGVDSDAAANGSRENEVGLTAADVGLAVLWCQPGQLVPHHHDLGVHVPPAALDLGGEALRSTLCGRCPLVRVAGSTLRDLRILNGGSQCAQRGVVVRRDEVQRLHAVEEVSGRLAAEHCGEFVGRGAAEGRRDETVHTSPELRLISTGPGGSVGSGGRSGDGDGGLGPARIQVGARVVPLLGQLFRLVAQLGEPAHRLGGAVRRRRIGRDRRRDGDGHRDRRNDHAGTQTVREPEQPHVPMSSRPRCPIDQPHVSGTGIGPPAPRGKVTEWQQPCPLRRLVQADRCHLALNEAPVAPAPRPALRPVGSGIVGWIRNVAA